VVVTNTLVYLLAFEIHYGRKKFYRTGPDPVRVPRNRSRMSIKKIVPSIVWFWCPTFFQLALLSTDLWSEYTMMI